jgi:LacI family transcriptional regulator
MGKKRVTLTDIANELDIDVSTVSKALKKHPKISDTTIKKVSKVARRLNYRPNDIATALVKGKSNLIGVMVPHTDENFFASAIRGIEEVAKKEGYHITIFQSNDDTNDEKSNIETMYRARVDGIIASHAMETHEFGHYQDILDQDIPLVLFDRFNDAIDSDVVAIDDFKGAYKAVSHLIDQGCSRITHIAGQLSVHIYKERYRGYKQALEDHGLSNDENLVVESDMSLEGGRKRTLTLLNNRKKPDAIFASNDYTALGAIQILQENNIDIPEEVAVVGFSNEAFTSYVTPTISSIEQHSRKMGKIAAQHLLDQISGSTESSNTKRPQRKANLRPERIVEES